jgi:hypothetical protein
MRPTRCQDGLGRSRIGRLGSNDERWITMKKFALLALLLCLAVAAGCDNKEAGKGSGSAAPASAGTGS